MPSEACFQTKMYQYAVFRAVKLNFKSLLDEDFYTLHIEPEGFFYLRTNLPFVILKI
jgi:hypothetical protein